MGACQRPSGRGVIEGSAAPVRGGVAHLALLREPSGRVIRIVGTLKILQVATDTGGGGEVVVTVGMALRALHADMGTRQREPGFRVIELSRLPGGRAMAHLALLRQSGGGVIRIRRSLEILQVTGNASRRRQVVIPIGMALCALHLRMCTGQWERGLGMIKGGGLPCGRLMANLALLRNPGGDVIGIGC